MRYFLIYIIAFFTLYSCVPEPIDVELDEYEPEIVIASQVIPDYIMAIGLTRSFTVLSDAGFAGEGDSALFSQILVDSALVVITSSSGVDTLEQLSPGLFVSINELQQPGGNYHLEVYDYALKKRATATSTMLQNIPIDTAFPEMFVTGGDTTIEMNIKYTDPAIETNYYVLSIYSRNISDIALDVNTFFQNGSNRIEHQELITDRGQDGKKISKNIVLDDVTMRDSLVVTLSNISEGYYRFLTSRERSGNLLSEITNEPINYPTNINNGLGYFNTHHPSIKFFNLSEVE